MKTIADLQKREEQLLRLIADRASPAGEKANAVVALAKVQEELDALGAPRRALPGNEEPRETRRGVRPFRARFSGWCWSCEMRFEKGALIIASGDDRRWIHAACAELRR